MLNVKILNDQAQLNNYFYVSAVQYVPGETIKISFQFFDLDSQVRFIPPVAATCTVTFQKNDGTALVKNAAMLFPADDRSMWQVLATAAESLTIVGVNFLATLDANGDGSNVQMAPAVNVLSPNLVDGDC